jgi:hypothetical protein
VYTGTYGPMCLLCPWTHFARQSVMALQGNFEIPAGQSKNKEQATVTRREAKRIPLPSPLLEAIAT